MPNCPTDYSRGGMSDGCGKTCGCASGSVLYGGSCCKPNCPTDGSRGGMSDGCGNTCGCKSGTTLYMGACCTPNCPTDYSRGGMDDACGKTCGCQSGSVLYGGSCCKPNCPADGSRGGMDDTCGKTCGCTSGTTLYMGACCTPNCPTDYSRGGMDDTCGKTCGCQSGSVLYGGSCCKPNCPTDGSRGGMDDGCGKTCGCPSGKALYMGACCAPNCPTDNSRAGMPDGCGKTCALHERLGPLRRRLLQAELPHRRHLRRHQRLRRHLRLRRRRHVHQRRSARARSARRPAVAASCATTASACRSPAAPTSFSAAAAAAAPARSASAASASPGSADARERNVRTAGRNVDTALALAGAVALAASLAGCFWGYPPERRASEQADGGTKPPPVTIQKCKGLCTDFPTAPIITGGAPANAPSMFTAAGTAAGPCISEPEQGTLLPNNWLRPRVKVSAPGASLLQITFHSDKEANDLVVYTAGDNWAMDRTIWQNIATHVVDSAITVSVRALGASGPTMATTSSFTIAPVAAGGKMVYWALRGYDASIPTNTELFGFGVGDEHVVSVLAGAASAADDQRRIGDLHRLPHGDARRRIRRLHRQLPVGQRARVGAVGRDRRRCRRSSATPA